jgi:uncharacterized membrane protein YfbV (UPF0208 family)
MADRAAADPLVQGQKQADSEPWDKATTAAAQLTETFLEVAVVAQAELEDKVTEQPTLAATAAMVSRLVYLGQQLPTPAVVVALVEPLVAQQVLVVAG